MLETELAIIPGKKHNTAIRVCLEAADGAVRLEQLAHSRAMGWYTQKTFRIPAELLSVLLPELRKANCLAPRAPAATASNLTMRLVPDAPEDRLRIA